MMTNMSRLAPPLLIFWAGRAGSRESQSDPERAREGRRGRGSNQKEKFVANLSGLLSGTLWLPLAPPDSF